MFWTILEGIDGKVTVELGSGMALPGVAAVSSVKTNFVILSTDFRIDLLWRQGRVMSYNRVQRGLRYCGPLRKKIYVERLQR